VTIYASTDTTLVRGLLHHYGIKYLVMGPVERAYYPPAGLAKFAAMDGLRVVYRNAGGTIYEVE
jgi:uncharacterized membrane protein